MCNSSPIEIAVALIVPFKLWSFVNRVVDRSAILSDTTVYTVVLNETFQPARHFYKPGYDFSNTGAWSALGKFPSDGFKCRLCHVEFASGGTARQHIT